MNGELQLRLAVEAAVRASPTDFTEVGRHLRRLSRDARALRAFGAIDADLAASIVAEAELALFLRGATWLEVVLSDLPSPAWMAEIGELDGRGRMLLSVLDAGDAGGGMAVEIWRDELVVRSAGSPPWRMAGGLPDDQERLEVRTSSGVGVFDLTRASPVVVRPAEERPPRFDDLLVAWGIVSELLPLPSARRTPASGFEVVAVRSGPTTVTVIERGEILHGDLGPAPALGWVRSSAGIHALREGFVIDPPVPPPPSRLTLALLDEGRLREVVLRESETPESGRPDE